MDNSANYVIVFRLIVDVFLSRIAAPRLPDLDEDDDPSAAPPGPDPAAARIGPFTAGTVLQSLVYGTGGDEQDAADADSAAAVAAAGSAVPALQVLWCPKW